MNKKQLLTVISEIENSFVEIDARLALFGLMKDKKIADLSDVIRTQINNASGISDLKELVEQL